MADHPVPASAVELTDEEIQERAQQMFALDQAVRAGLNKGREGLWDAARALHAFDAEAGWSALGYESVRHYCADPEIGISRSTYHRMIRAYEQTVVRRQIDFDRIKQLDRSKVDIVLSKVTTGEKAIDEALDDAETLGLQDLRELYWGPRPAKEEAEKEEAEVVGGGVTDDTTPEVEDETGGLVGLDDEPIDAEVVEDFEDVPTAEAAETEPETETDPQSIYGEVLLQRVREALTACRQGLDSPSDLLRRVALEKAVGALEAVLDAG
jgi:hypothetical protein